MLLNWMKSSHSAQDNCLEAAFHKSSYSHANGSCLEAAYKRSSRCANSSCLEAAYRRSSWCASGQCVEAALPDGMVLVRDSKLGDASPVLSFSPEAWQAFTEGIKEDS